MCVCACVSLVCVSLCVVLCRQDERNLRNLDCLPVCVYVCGCECTGMAGATSHGSDERNLDCLPVSECACVSICMYHGTRLG